MPRHYICRYYYTYKVVVFVVITLFTDIISTAAGFLQAVAVQNYRVGLLDRATKGTALTLAILPVCTLKVVGHLVYVHVCLLHITLQILDGYHK